MEIFRENLIYYNKELEIQIFHSPVSHKEWKHNPCRSISSIKLCNHKERVNNDKALD